MKIIVVDDHALVRAQLRQLLSGYRDIEVVGEAEDGVQALALAQQHRPDVILMDVNLPRIDGITATRILTHERLCRKVVGISFRNDQATESAMREAGASAFLSKTDVAGRLYDTLRDVTR